MKLKNLGIIQIILGAIIISAEIFQHNFKPFDPVYIKLLKLVFSSIFNPMVIIAILLVLLGYFFIRSNQDINFHIDSLLSKFNINIPNKMVGIVILTIGILILVLPIYMAGLFSTFSFSRLASLFFDDAKIPLTAISFSLILIGAYIIVKNKNSK